MTNAAQYRSDAHAQRDGAHVISWHRSVLALLAGTVVLLVSAMYAVAPAQSSSALKRCGASAGSSKYSGTIIIFVNIRARGASCETARVTAKQWQSNNLHGQCFRTCRVRSFKCTSLNTKTSADILVDCRRSGQRVLFTYKLSIK